FVERSVDPADRRSRVLVLTDMGRRAREDLVRAAMDNTPLGVLDDDELRQLLVLLHRAVPAQSD
ncbi:MarR family winged helix-turn-helix transcriptional regulator, partial [Escherichia coli]|uniref:MarR family winged helix-turn-helix transcriptional regulator n=1 Tax=Escherichia coli TaxID=562 RepID=UPI0018EEF83F